MYRVRYNRGDKRVTSTVSFKKKKNAKKYADRCCLTHQNARVIEEDDDD